MPRMYREMGGLISSPATVAVTSRRARFQLFLTAFGSLRNWVNLFRAFIL
jgi:hypothetical protein